MKMNAIELGVFASRIEAVCDEMGAVLKRAAFSPNIKDRLDYSCAVFDVDGQLCAQAAHIPVHLGSMAYAMSDIISRLQWCSGDMAVVNDPYLGGTHLPDVTVIAPVFIGDTLLGFVANRAHHANIGATAPGSMPVSTSLDQEGIVIAPTYIEKDGKPVEPVMEKLCGGRFDLRARGDFAAQISANKTGVTRLLELIQSLSDGEGQNQSIIRYKNALSELNDYGERLARTAIQAIPQGCYQFTDYMDDDGAGGTDIEINVQLNVIESGVDVSFADTSPQVQGNINCPLSVAAAAVYYVFRCLMPEHTPACAGSFRPITVSAPEGSLVNASRPAAVAAGNVETSTRIVDTVLGALAKAIPDRIPAASQGSMNNIAMGSEGEKSVAAWDYYETVGGGMGAGPRADGWSGVQTHMTNTLNTPVESLEYHYPLRVVRYAIRQNSGGEGVHCGGEGLIREFEFLSSAQVTLLTERRKFSPWGLQGGAEGGAGINRLNGQPLSGKCHFKVDCGDRLMIVTPGGGGWGKSAVGVETLNKIE